MRKSRKTNNIITAFIFVTCILFAFPSCTNIFKDELEKKTDDNTYLIISNDDVSIKDRSIEPTKKYMEENLKNIFLYATKAGGTRKTLLSSVNNLTTVYNKQLLLDDGAGTYTF